MFSADWWCLHNKMPDVPCNGMMWRLSQGQGACWVQWTLTLRAKLWADTMSGVGVRGGRWSLFGLRVNTRRDPESMSRLTSGLTPLPNTGRGAIICSEPRVHAIKANVFTRRDLLHLKLTCCITIFMDRGPHLRSFSYNASSKSTTAYAILPNFSKI